MTVLRFIYGTDPQEVMSYFSLYMSDVISYRNIQKLSAALCLLTDTNTIEISILMIMQTLLIYLELET